MKEKSFEPGRDNIVLIGMPGAGKSTLGIVLAKILCMNFVDADLLIQQSCDKPLQRLIDTLGPDAFIVTPGVRPAGAALGDQSRVATPAQAFENGASHIVVGRPITEADDPVAAFEAIAVELE